MAVVDALFVRPFSAKPFLSGQRWPRPIGCDVFCLARLLRGCTRDGTDERERGDDYVEKPAHESLLEVASIGR